MHYANVDLGLASLGTKTDTTRAILLPNSCSATKLHVWQGELHNLAATGVGE